MLRFMKWEYKKINKQFCNLNFSGALEWELCATDNDYLYFKRPMSCRNCKYCKSNYNSKVDYCEYTCTLHNKLISVINLDGCINFSSL